MPQLSLLTSEAAALPAYRVRESRRAKNVSLKIDVTGEVEVVVPPGYDQGRIPDLVRQRQGWILKHQRRLGAARQDTVADWQAERPQRLELRWNTPQSQARPADSWRVIYEPQPGPTLCLPLSDKTLKVRGSDRNAAHTQVLRDWLAHYAQRQLVPWLRQLSFDIDLPFRQVKIRGQKTRWGSCSSQQHISLNYKLLFLPQELVRYVLVHELCHTVHMNHSAAFWRLVEQKLPGHAPHRQALKQGWKYVPRWVET